MAILYDARGNEIRTSYPDTVTNETVTDGRTISASLSAANAEVIMDLNGAQTASFDVRAVANAALTFVFEGTFDGTNYFGLPAFTISSNLAAGTLAAEVFVSTVTLATQTLIASYIVGVTGFRRIRLRVATYTSGTIVVASRASVADQLIYARPFPAVQHVTVTAAVNTAATITLPAVAGLFHYITWLHASRTAAAAIVGTGTLITTSTNLPGNPAWTNGNALAVGDSRVDLDYQPSSPLKSLVAGTATTIVLPNPGLTALARGNCSYFVGA